LRRIAATFRALAARREPALVTFVTAGDPDLDTTEMLLPRLAAAGADLIEVGVPFSDPVAEGPTIQRASQRALASGTSLRRILEMVKRVRNQISGPIVLMGYANPFLSFGTQAFAAAAVNAGVDGVIVPDLPPEEEPEFFAVLEAAGVDAILLAAPTTTPERLALLAERTRGFLYYVSVVGVTGARTELPPDLAETLERVRAAAHGPVCVGFGIATPKQARSVGRLADGVVVGSAIVERIENAESRATLLDDIPAFVAQLKDALGSGGPS
jgi:tryptophan synthase alpha chain